jgi:hypothetical protein
LATEIHLLPRNAEQYRIRPPAEVEAEAAAAVAA